MSVGPPWIDGPSGRMSGSGGFQVQGQRWLLWTGPYLQSPGLNIHPPILLPRNLISTLQSPEPRDARPPHVQFRVGQVVKHKR